MSRLRGASVPILLWFLVTASSRTAQSAILTLFTDAPTENPLVITPLDADRQLLVSVVNAVADDPPDQFMTSWQFRVHAVPDARTTGILNFASGSEPSNYALAGVSHPFGPASAPLPGDPTIFTALDTAVPTNVGAQVPTAPGANLLSITFGPSIDALGTFGIYALNSGSDSTIWTDAASDPVNHSHDFINVPSGGEPVRIANVIVTSVADYNRNGTVDAADYTVWRNTLGEMGTGLDADGDASGTVDDDDYDVWKTHFGEIAGSGSGGASPYHAAVPEPASAILAAVAAVAVISVGWRALISHFFKEFASRTTRQSTKINR